MAKCSICGYEVTCFYSDIGGSSEYRDLFFYVCTNCGHKGSDEQYIGQTACGGDEITHCPFCSDSCIEHLRATAEDLHKFHAADTPQS